MPLSMYQASAVHAVGTSVKKIEAYLKSKDS